MEKGGDISSFHVEVRHGAAVGRAHLYQLLASAEFRAVADLLPEGVVVADPDGRILFGNDIAARMSGRKGALEGRSFEQFLRDANIDAADLAGPASRGRSRQIVRDPAEGRCYTMIRRTILVIEEVRGFSFYLFREGEARGGGKFNGRETAPNVGADEQKLLFPPDLELRIGFAQRAYARGARILLLGESGVGKTAIAKHIHSSGASAGAPMVHVNCGSIPETLFESEMFGYERGAFTGALANGKRGYIESAHGGTLYLDEIGEIPLASQAKLLKYLEDGTIQPVGSPTSKMVNARVIAATNRDLAAMVEAGGFRRDLYFRLATFPVHIPPLRERSDMAAIIDEMVDRLNRRRAKPLILSAKCRAALLARNYSGNLRELRNCIEYLDIVADQTATPEHLPDFVIGASTSPQADRGVKDSGGTGGATLKELTRAFEEEVIQQHIARYGSKREAARHLGVDIATLVRKTARH